MTTVTRHVVEPMDDVMQLLSRRVLAPTNMIHLFTDSTDFVASLCEAFGSKSQRLISAGHATPDIAIAVDRAEMGIHEVLGSSPFSCDISSVVAAIKSPSDIVYIANPNRITGTTSGAAEIAELATAVPDGLVIVDEYYFDFYGISAVPLLDRHANIVVIRSLTAAFGLSSSDIGFAVAHPGTFYQMGISNREQHFTATVRKTAVASLMNDIALSNHLQTIHDESLRMTSSLNRMEVRSRITAADALLIRVTNVAQVGNILARYRIPFENLDGYPRLNGFLKYRIQSPLSNDKCLEAFSRMPAELLKTTPSQLGTQILRRPSEPLGSPSVATDPPDAVRHEVFRAIDAR